MPMSKDLVGAFNSILGQVDLQADLFQVLCEHFLVDQVVFNKEHLVSLVAHALFDVEIALLLRLHDSLGRGAVSINAEITFVGRIEDDGKP